MGNRATVVNVKEIHTVMRKVVDIKEFGCVFLMGFYVAIIVN